MRHERNVKRCLVQFQNIILPQSEISIPLVWWWVRFRKVVVPDPFQRFSFTYCMGICIFLMVCRRELWTCRFRKLTWNKVNFLIINMFLYFSPVMPQQPSMTPSKTPRNMSTLTIMTMTLEGVRMSIMEPGFFQPSMPSSSFLVFWETLWSSGSLFFGPESATWLTCAS